MYNLDDTNQTVFYIPFSDTGNEDGGVLFNKQPLLSNVDYDLPNGEELRFEAYREAWGKCLGRIQSIIRTIYAPTVAQVVQQVRNSYENPLPGLPYPEIPTICITNPTCGSSFVNEISSELDAIDFENEALFDNPSFVTHLYPHNCVNLTSTMKSVISGFIGRPHVLKKVGRKPTTSLASHDIELLVTWYKAVCEVYDVTPESLPKLIVMLHDFEQFDPTVIQDLLYICRLHVPQLPFVFILSMSSPSSPPYLHSTYPRSTLILLRIHDFAVPSGIRILEEVILKTFFTLEFEPDIVLGPAIITFLVDYFVRQNSSLESCITILQLAHMKHFFNEPLTLLVQSTPASKAFLKSSSFENLDALLGRLHDRPPTDTIEPMTITTLLALIDVARMGFYSHARRIRIGFGILRLVHQFMQSQGFKGLDWDRHTEGTGILDVLIDALKGELSMDVRYVGSMVKKLRLGPLNMFLEQMSAYFHSMPPQVRSDEEDAQVKLDSYISVLPESLSDNDASDVDSQLASSVAKWLVEYLNHLLETLEERVLWEIWYTGRSPFPSDLVNPSVRASTLSGLLRPYDFAEPNDDEQQPSFSLWELPDTSILFRRYLDSGKMINVYDWFESFQLVLETQRKQLKKRHISLEANRFSRKGKSNAKKPKAPQADVDVDDEDQWKAQVQARFMGALQELDYLGFIKHTGRKADHVQRTVYDIYD